MNNTSTFTLTGSAGVDLPAGIGQVEATFGSQTHDPGLVITNGSLTSLDMTISANFGIAGVNLAQANFQFTYTAATDEFTMTGTATADLDLAGDRCHALGRPRRDDVGRRRHPGAGRPERRAGLAEHGRLRQLLDRLAQPEQVNFVMTYRPRRTATACPTPSEFIMSGTASLNLYNVITLNIDLGQERQPGLVVENGTLETLDFSVDTSISFLGLLTANLDVSASYSASTGILDFQGNAGLALNWSVLPRWMHPSGAARCRWASSASRSTWTPTTKATASWTSRPVSPT